MIKWRWWYALSKRTVMIRVIKNDGDDMRYQKGLGVTLGYSFLSNYWKDLILKILILHLSQKFYVSTFYFHKVSQLFADKEFCVINGPAEHSKQDIEKKIVEVSLISVIILFYVVFNVLFRLDTAFYFMQISLNFIELCLLECCFPCLFPAICCLLVKVILAGTTKIANCMVKNEKNVFKIPKMFWSTFNNRLIWENKTLKTQENIGEFSRVFWSLFFAKT